MVKWIPTDVGIVLGCNACYAHRQSVLHRGICPTSHFPSYAFVIHMERLKVHIRLFPNNTAIVTGCIESHEVRNALRILNQEWAKMQHRCVKVQLTERLTTEPKIGHDEIVYGRSLDDHRYHDIIGYRFHENKKQPNKASVRYFIHGKCTRCVPSSELNVYLNGNDEDVNNVISNESILNHDFFFVEEITSSSLSSASSSSSQTPVATVFTLDGHVIGHLRVHWLGTIHLTGNFRFLIQAQYILIYGKVAATLHFYINVPLANKIQAIANPNGHVSSVSSTSTSEVIYRLSHLTMSSDIYVFPASNMHCLSLMASNIDVQNLFQIRQHWAIASTLILTDRDQLLFTYEMPRDLNSLDPSIPPEKRGSLPCDLPKQNCPNCKHISVKIFVKGSVILTGIDDHAQIPHLQRFLNHFLSAP